VFASGISAMGYVLKGLFTGAKSMTMAQLFWTDPARTGSYNSRSPHRARRAR